MILKMNRTNDNLKVVLISAIILSNYLGLSTCDNSSFSRRGEGSNENRRSSLSLAHRSRRSHVNHHHQHNHHHRHNQMNSINTERSNQLNRLPHETQEQVEDRNELQQLQSTETATFLSVPRTLENTRFGVGIGVGVGIKEQHDKEAMIGITHEKHHLWKLTLEQKKSKNEDDNRDSGQDLHLKFEQNQNQMNRNIPIDQVTPQTFPINETIINLGSNISPNVVNPSDPDPTGDSFASAVDTEFFPPNYTIPKYTQSTQIVTEREFNEVNTGKEIDQDVMGKPSDSVNLEDMQNTANTNSGSGGNVNEHGNANLEIGNNGIVKLSTVDSSLSQSSPASSNDKDKVGCRSCILNKELESALPAVSLREIRLELIKEQILRKLGLKEPPNTTYLAKEHLPLPVAQGSILPKRHGRHSHYKALDRDIDDFYGKTEQVIIFPEDVLPRCLTHRTDPSACFTFNLPQENNADQVSSAQLWVYKLPGKNEGRNQSFWIDEVSLSQADVNDESLVRMKNIEIIQNIVVKEGWMKLNLTRIMSKWMSTNDSEHTLQIGCKTCLVDPSETPIDTYGDQRPFIVISYKNFAQKKRSRRNINCSPRLTECCREPFVVSFREIGWDSWIINPDRYDAFYCTGSCVSINGIAHSTARHTTVMQKYIRTFGITNKTAKIVPCCTASKMSPISIVYRDPHHLNHTIKTQILPNMVVESCGCL